MKFTYSSEMLTNENTYLITNGLGGYSSVSAVFSAPRSDQGILVAAVKAPNVRINLVHRIRETLSVSGREVVLSGQTFPDAPAEEGRQYLESFTFDGVPVWYYRVGDAEVVRRCSMDHGTNTVAVLYEIRNRGDVACSLTVTPFFKFAPKEEAVTETKTFVYCAGTVTDGRYVLKLRTDGVIEEEPLRHELLAYPEDAKDGRPDRGLCGSCLSVRKTVEAGQNARMEVVFSAEDAGVSGWKLLEDSLSRWETLAQSSGFAHPLARELARSADAYIARRESTDGKTILAGYPLFSDWGRDTMITLPGCAMATGRMEDARSILRTFLAYEKDGLVPNLFPEGDIAPMYNTVDAALLLIDAVWQYLQRTGDKDFAREAWPVLERIVAGYRKGTHHGIGMDSDGLIYAGQGLDQVTWMDVCVQGILPTPRHGKPVEINAYWYNALMIMDRLAELLELDRGDYAALAQQVRSAFTEKFYMEDRGYLKDVLSGTQADTQIRCNQIWALSMPFTMLTPEQEKNVLETVRRHLYTPWGLRTLSPEDKQYRGFYGGSQLDRDLAYHQGTVWVFPMGAYYRAWLKVYGQSAEAVRTVKEGLANLQTMMTQGCAGQLPEIYDGNVPGEGKGCFAQAWSVGEMLRVFEDLEQLEKEQV